MLGDDVGRVECGAGHRVEFQGITHGENHVVLVGQQRNQSGIIGGVALVLGVLAGVAGARLAVLGLAANDGDRVIEQLGLKNEKVRGLPDVEGPLVNRRPGLDVIEIKFGWASGKERAGAGGR